VTVINQVWNQLIRCENFKEKIQCIKFWTFLNKLIKNSEDFGNYPLNSHLIKNNLLRKSIALFNFLKRLKGNFPTTPDLGLSKCTINLLYPYQWSTFRILQQTNRVLSKNWFFFFSCQQLLNFSDQSQLFEPILPPLPLSLNNIPYFTTDQQRF
jgi:hypothetical protein